MYVLFHYNPATFTEGKWCGGADIIIFYVEGPLGKEQGNPASFRSRATLMLHRRGKLLHSSNMGSGLSGPRALFILFPWPRLCSQVKRSSRPELRG
ncbi:hypothetical protein E2320_002142 [Naja naja]|nr:hypothetical protein E2320_002142 [Naja naja]